ncbi:glycosyltransferase family 4 protein [Candidatus Woesearchaeota archaeon]|nr:glycosyltransferase family 4 protein [Candidatus Woesearchaeota archaeon]
MKLLVLTSRYTANRDIIGEDFGRQTRLFSALKKFKHDIGFFAADYRKFEKKNVKLHGINISIRPFSIFHFFSFIKNLDSALKSKEYDFLIASSDPLWGVIGYVFAKKHDVKFIYDLHDNYETYATYNIPFFRHMDNFVLKNADLVTTVSFALKNKIKPIRAKNVFVVQNGADTKLFKPMDRLHCRNALKLPKNAKIIAYAGSIQRLQGINLLVDVFNELKEEIKNLKLAIAGRFVKGEEKYINLDYEGVIYLKSLAQDKIVRLINAADVVVVPNPANAFTKYCFPYKVVEYMACNAPVVATDVGDVGLFLRRFKGSLCKENDRSDMKEKIRLQLQNKRAKYGYRAAAMSNSWENIALRLDKVLKENI